MIDFRDRKAKELGIDMLVYTNQDGVAKGINPFDHGSAYTDIMKTQALKQALKKYGFTAAFGGGRRDEESRVPRSESSRSETRRRLGIQRTSVRRCGSCTTPRFTKERAFACSRCPTGRKKTSGSTSSVRTSTLVPLYFAAERPVVERDGNLIMVDDDRMRLLPGEKPMMKSVRFRTLGCYPLTGGVESTATTLDEVISETLSAVTSERTSRVIDKEAAGSMERRKREGYF